jgi:hypothetical protein
LVSSTSWAAVGVAERDRLITGKHVRPGDVLIGLPSPNLRSNGYSLARRVFFDIGERPIDGPAYAGAAHTLGDELLKPSVIYAPAILALLRDVDVRAVAHITGGGIPGNLNRVLPAKADAVVERRSWEVPRVFTEIQRVGDISDDEIAKNNSDDRRGAGEGGLQGHRHPAQPRAPGGGGRRGRRRPRRRPPGLTHRPPRRTVTVERAWARLAPAGPRSCRLIRAPRPSEQPGRPPGRATRSRRCRTRCAGGTRGSASSGCACGPGSTPRC